MPLADKYLSGCLLVAAVVCVVFLIPTAYAGARRLARKLLGRWWYRE